MKHSAELRRCLLDLDVIGICNLWFHIYPHLPQPRNNDEALITLHHARTRTESIPDQHRCYSHSWLLERGLPSGLPDHLKQKADRLYPRVVDAVGVAVKSMSGDTDRAKAVEQVMSNAVAECYADGVKDVEIIKARMAEAREALK